MESIDEDILRMKEIMREAGRIVLDDFAIRSDVEKVVYPERYTDEAGSAMWDLVMEELDGSQLDTPKEVAVHARPGRRFRR